MTPRQVYHWVKQVSKHWRHMTDHERDNIVLFSRGVVLTGSSHIRKIAGCVGGQPNSQRRRLQRFLKNPRAMDGFVKDWTHSVVSVLPGKRVVLAVDETKLRDRIGVMVVAVVVGERAIPLAWRCYKANSKADYPAEGQAGMILKLLHQVQAGMPADREVLVLADRGIGTSANLMRGIMAMGWTFLFRVTKQSKIVLEDGTAVTFYAQVTNPGDTWGASGLVFKKRGRVPAHVRVLWHTDAKEPWSLVTNDPDLTGYDYARRMWIEQAFRDLKSHGWHCEDAALDDPARVQRLWILLVVAYAWMLFLGIAVATDRPSMPRKRRKNGTLVRAISLFQEGRHHFLASAFP